MCGILIGIFGREWSWVICHIFIDLFFFCDVALCIFQIENDGSFPPLAWIICVYYYGLGPWPQSWVRALCCSFHCVYRRSYAPLWLWSVPKRRSSWWKCLSFAHRSISLCTRVSVYHRLGGWLQRGACCTLTACCDVIHVSIRNLRVFLT
jgi:hypothetical protein